MSKPSVILDVRFKTIEIHKFYIIFDVKAEIVKGFEKAMQMQLGYENSCGCDQSWPGNNCAHYLCNWMVKKG